MGEHYWVGSTVELCYVNCIFVVLWMFLFLCYFLIRTCLKKITSLGTCWIQGKRGLLFRISFRYAHLSAYKSKPCRFWHFDLQYVSNHVFWLGNKQRMFRHLSTTMFYVSETASSRWQPLPCDRPASKVSGLCLMGAATSKEGWSCLGKG